MPNDLKHIQASISLISTDWLCLRVAQMPTCQDLVIFVVTTDRQTDRQTDYFTPVHACRVITYSIDRLTINVNLYMHGNLIAKFCH